MICYKDMTFCVSKSCKKWEGCFRALTKEVEKNAEIWWGNKDYPIAVFTEEPECYKE